MDSLNEQYISDTFPGLLHASGAELPVTGQKDIFDGNGNKTSMSLGREGQGVTLKSPTKIGLLEYPNDNNGTAVGSIMVQTSPNKLGLKNVNTIYEDVINHIYPIGSIFISADGTNPSTRFVNTSWEQIAQGRFISSVGNSAGKNINPGENTGSYSITVGIPDHYHGVGRFDSDGNDDAHFIVASYTLPGPWVDTYRSYYARMLNGDADKSSPYTIADGYNVYRSIITTSGFSFSNNSKLLQSDSVDPSPPSFGVYMWKRIS